MVGPDIQLGLFTASGLIEAREDWSKTGEDNIRRAMEQRMMNLGGRSKQIDSTALEGRAQQMVKLHDVVGDTILTFKFDPNQTLKLPTKKDVFDWSLGDGVQSIPGADEADFILFVHGEGAYASSGRIASQIVLGALFGVVGPLGGQAVFASLVDVRTGDIVWFNLATTAQGTDMRKPEGAEQIVKSLMMDFPV